MNRVTTKLRETAAMIFVPFEVFLDMTAGDVLRMQAEASCR